MKKYILVLFILLLALPVYAEDLYVGQSAAGGDDGSSCANQKAASWFNTSGSWGAGVGKISPGDTAHLCGTISTSLKVYGNGESGNEITIKFEDDAKLSQAACATYLLDLYGRSYIIVDGGTNGIIENTDNGDALGSQVSSSYGIRGASATHDIEIKNLTIQNLYVHTYGSEVGGGGLDIKGLAFFTPGGSNISVHDCVINNTTEAFFHQNVAGVTNSTISFYDNTVTRSNLGL